jgi:hypothetical protein
MLCILRYGLQAKVVEVVEPIVMVLPMLVQVVEAVLELHTDSLMLLKWVLMLLM